MLCYSYGRRTATSLHKNVVYSPEWLVVQRPHVRPVLPTGVETYNRRRLVHDGKQAFFPLYYAVAVVAMYVSV